MFGSARKAPRRRVAHLNRAERLEDRVLMARNPSVVSKVAGTGEYGGGSHSFTIDSPTFENTVINIPADTSSKSVTLTGKIVGPGSFPAPHTGTQIVVGGVVGGTQTFNVPVANGVFTLTPNVKPGTNTLTYNVLKTSTPVANAEVLIVDSESRFTGTVIVNNTPVAVDDVFTIPENTASARSILSGNLLLKNGAQGAADRDGDTSGPDDEDAGIISVRELSASETSGPTDTQNAVTVNNDGTFTYTPPLDFNGTYSFTYRVSDGYATDDATVTITVTPVNSPPVLTVPGTRDVLEDEVVTFAANQIRVADVDSASATFLVTLDARIFDPASGAVGAATGILTPGSSQGLTFDPASGTSGPSLRFSGSLADINAALSGLTFKPAVDYNGAVQVAITVSDQDATNPQSDQGNVRINFGAVADAPRLVGFPIAALEGTALTDQIVATFNDPDPSPIENYEVTINWGDLTGPTTGFVRRGLNGEFNVFGTHLYREQGTYTLIVEVREDGVAGVGTFEPPDRPATVITVADAPLRAEGLPRSAVEGKAFTNLVLATFTDPGGPDPVGDYTATIDWGDGTTSTGQIEPQGLAFVVKGSHTYAEEGTFLARVTIAEVFEAGGSTVEAVAPISVAPVPLVVSPATITGTEGVLLNEVTVATFTDVGGPGLVGEYSATIDWGDGTPATAGRITLDSSGTLRVLGSHVYADESPTSGFTVRVNIVEQNGGTGAARSTANIANAPLSAGGRNLAAVEGSPFVNVPVATFFDVGGADAASRYAATIDWGDGTDPTPGLIVASGLGFTVLGSHAYAEEGIFTVSVVISESGGLTARTEGAATVSPVPLVAQGLPVIAVEGVPLSGVAVASFTDVGGLGPNSVAGDYTATIDWGDGTAPTPGSILLDGGTFTVLGSHTYADEGSYVVRVTIAEQGGSTGLATTTAQVVDGPIGGGAGGVRVFPISATEDVLLPNILVASFSVVDPNAQAGEFSASIDWGDGTPASVGTVEAVEGSGGSLFSVRGGHTYDRPGRYAITVAVASRGGATAAGSGSVDVADVPIAVTGVGLDPASDSGLFATDRITNVVRPTFSGSSEPGASIVLMARRFDASGATVVGTAVADPAGFWQITTSTLADGRHDLAVVATDRDGISTSTTPLAPIFIDTAGPRVTGARFNARTGQLLFTIGDDRGLDIGSLVRPGTVSFLRPPARSGRNFLVTSLALAPGASAGSASLVATIGGGRRIGPGRYRLIVRAGGVTDAAGNPLEGDYFGSFPTGDGRLGGDFVANLTVASGRRPSLIPLVESIVPAGPVAARKAKR